MQLPLSLLIFGRRARKTRRELRHELQQRYCSQASSDLAPQAGLQRAWEADEEASQKREAAPLEWQWKDKGRHSIERDEPGASRSSFGPGVDWLLRHQHEK